MPQEGGSLVALALAAVVLTFVSPPVSGAVPSLTAGLVQDESRRAASAQPAEEMIPKGGSASGDSRSKDRDSTSDGVFFIAPARNSPRLAPKFRVSQMCATGELDHRTCKIKWALMLRQEMLHLTSEHAWNIATNHWIRVALTGPLPGDPDRSFVTRWLNSVRRFRFGRWNDDNPFLDDYIGHPMMGAISMDVFIQNDPSGMSLELQNTRQYWMSRLRALGWATIYSTQWKIGPASEASIGNQGLDYYQDLDSNIWTNGTGFAGLVTTPVGGLVWSIGEDAMDKYVTRHLEHVSRNRLWLASISFLTPSRAFANLMRFKSPWYRDSRPVRGHDLVPEMTVAVPAAATMPARTP